MVHWLIKKSEFSGFRLVTRVLASGACQPGVSCAAKGLELLDGGSRWMTARLTDVQ